MIAAVLGAANVNTVEGAPEEMSSSTTLGSEIISDILGISNLYDAYQKRESLSQFLDYVVTLRKQEVEQLLELIGPIERLKNDLNNLPNIDANTPWGIQKLRNLDWGLFGLFYSCNTFSEINKHDANKYMLTEPYKFEGLSQSPRYAMDYLLRYLAVRQGNEQARKIYIKLRDNTTLDRQIFNNGACYGTVNCADVSSTTEQITNLAKQYQSDFNSYLEKEKGFQRSPYADLVERLKEKPSSH